MNRILISLICVAKVIYISKKVNVYDLLDNGYDDKLMKLVEEDDVQFYRLNMFNEDMIKSVEQDLKILQELQSKWNDITEDPKKSQFIYELTSNIKLIDKKIIVFTESTETASYVSEYLEQIFPNKVLLYHGQASQAIRQEIEENYNPNYTGEKKDNIKYLVTTDVLAEGINLHRSNVIINYDLPWNPTKVMQRVGRINRVGTEYNEIHVFNFFPTAHDPTPVLLHQ